MDTKTIEKNVILTIHYFTFFKYTPNFEEIHKFHPQKTTKKALQNALNQLISQGRIVAGEGCLGIKTYTPRGYNKLFVENAKRAVISSQKIKSIDRYCELLKKFSQIKFIGISGSVGVLNAKQADDIDIFVITSQNRLWTGRFISLIIASLLGRRRKRAESHVNDKICLNLFFQENNLKISGQKRSYFVAHEVLQMKPSVDKAQTFRRFLKANSWVFDYYPNASPHVPRLQQSSYSPRNRKETGIGNLVEALLKKCQLFLINRHKTKELILPGQLWFFPDDYEPKVRKLLP